MVMACAGRSHFRCGFLSLVLALLMNPTSLSLSFLFLPLALQIVFLFFDPLGFCEMQASVLAGVDRGESLF